VVRENMHSKAERLLLAGAVSVLYVNGRTVRAIVKGDSGAFYEVVHEAGTWSCSCPAWGSSSHRLAVMRCTVPAGAVVVTREAMLA
jgi:uncharacterized Zn finger protein